MPHPSLLNATGELQAAWEVVDAHPDDEAVEGMRFALHLYARDYEALLRLTADADVEVFETQWEVVPKAFIDATILTWMGRAGEARPLLDSARVILEERLAGTPDDARVHASLGEVHAWLGSTEAAVRHARSAVELYPVERDAVDGSTFLASLARTLVRTGRLDEAVNELEAAYAVPGRPTAADLRFNPIWDPLREHPGFLELLTRVESVASVS